MKDNNCCVTYRINERDEITSVNDDWCRYASEHGWENVSPDNAINMPIYHYITDTTTSIIYENLFKRVRGGSTVRYTFNCESSSHRRKMEMTVTALGNRGGVEIKARMLSKQARILQNINTEATYQQEKFMRACGWCYRIDMNGKWLDIEVAVSKLGIYEFSRLPKLTHGICKDCYSDMIKEVSSSIGIRQPSVSSTS